MTGSSRARAVLVGLCLGFAAPSAHAQPAEALLEHASELRQEGEHEAALALLEQAAERGTTPRVWGEMALSELALGRYREAERHAQRALAAEDDEWVGAHRAELTEALAEAASRLGTLELVGGPAGATLYDGDRRLGVLPLGPQRMAEGAHELELRLPDGEARTHEVTVEAEATTRLRLDDDGALASTPEARAPDEAPAEAADEGETADAMDGAPSPEADEAPLAVQPPRYARRTSAASAAAPSDEARFPDSFRDRFARGDGRLPEPPTREPWPNPWTVTLHGGVGWLYHMTDFALPTGYDGNGGDSIAFSLAAGLRHGLGMRTELQARLEVRAYEHGEVRRWDPLDGDPVFLSVYRSVQGWVLGVVPEVGLRFRLGVNGASRAYFGLGLRPGLALFLQERHSRWRRDIDPIEIDDRHVNVGFAPEGLAEFGVVLGPRSRFDLGLRMTGGFPGFMGQVVLGVPLGEL